MKQPAKKKGVVFYEETSWFHRVKLLQPDGSVKYSKRGGFQSEAEAEASYYKYEEEFKKASRTYQMSAKPNADVDLKIICFIGLRIYFPRGLRIQPAWYVLMYCTT